MKTRIVSALIGIIILFAVVLPGQAVLVGAILAIALIAMNEFFNSVSIANIRPIKFVGYISCFLVPFIAFRDMMKYVGIPIDVFETINYFSFAIFLIVVMLFGCIVFLRKKHNFNDAAVTMFGIVYIVFMLSFLALTRNLNGGYYYIWLVFIGAWTTDTFAYFSGRLFGHTLLIPEISPKKTVEGAIGGMVGCVIVTMIYGLFANGIPLYHFAIMGILNGIMAQLGDLAASAIKRHVGVKDFGNIMPGHGGVLDRFDSVLFIAPIVYFYVSIILP